MILSLNQSVGVVEGDNLKITSKTKVGELVRTFVLKEEGKELEIVSTRINPYFLFLSKREGRGCGIHATSNFFSLQHLKCEEKGATAKRFFSKIE